MGASLGFFGRVRPTCPLPVARGRSPNLPTRGGRSSPLGRRTRLVGVLGEPGRPACLAESVWPSGRRQGRRPRLSVCRAVEPGWGLQTRPTRNASGPGPGWSNPATELTRRGRESGPAVEPGRLGVPVGWHSLNRRVEGGRLGVRRSRRLGEPCRLGVESRSSRARPGPTRSGVVDSL